MRNVSGLANYFERETKEITIAHIAIFILAGLVYLGTTLEITVIFYAGAMFLELIFFHVLWIYRDNQDREHPIVFAVGVEMIYLTLAVITLIITGAIAYEIYRFIGFPFLYSIAIIYITGTITWILWRKYD